MPENFDAPVSPVVPLIAPASSQQQWEYDSNPGHISPINLAMSWLLHGRVEPSGVEAAVADIVESQHALRTAIRYTRDGLSQIVKPTATNVGYDDLRSRRPNDGWRTISAWLASSRARPRSLEHGTGLEVALWRFGAERWCISLGVAHSAWDAWSTRVFISALLQRAGDPAGPKPATVPMQYAAVTAADRRRGERAEFNSARHQLMSIRAAPAMPRAVKLAHESDFVVAATSLPLMGSRMRAILTTAARRVQAQTAAALVAALGVLECAVSAQRAQVVGVCYANRDRKEHQPLIAGLAETVPIVLSLDRCDTIADCIRAAALQLDACRDSGATMNAMYPRACGEGPWRGEAACDWQLNYRSRGPAAYDDTGTSIGARFLGATSHQPVAVDFLWPFALLDFTVASTQSGGYHLTVNYNKHAITPEQASGCALAFRHIAAVAALRPEMRVRQVIQLAKKWLGA